jgi:hypothetical protein
LSQERGYGVETIYALEEARELLQHHWTQGSFARDIQGKSVPVHSDRAVSFDLLGAIARVSNDDSTYAEIFSCISECIEESLPQWNDTASQEEILGMLSEVLGCLRSRNNYFADAA